MIKHTRPHICAALILCTPAAFAQEAKAPAANAAGQTPASNSLTVPTTVKPTPSTVAPLLPMTTGTSTAAGSELETKPSTAETEKGPDFMVPGGLGYAPLDFTPGQGRFDRKPLTLSTNVQMGYDDNINNSPGIKGTAPIQGSMLTNASEGVSLLLAESRLGLSLDGNVGGQYYWHRDQNQLTPTAGLNLVSGYKLTPRAQITALVNGIYTSQPTNSVTNGVNQSNGKGYFVGSSKFDLLYSWEPRISTDTYYSANGAFQEGSSSKSGNYLTQTIGQSLRYSFSRLLTGVVEGRYSGRTFGGDSVTGISQDTQTYFLLTGADITFSRLFNASFRVGDTTQHYNGGSASSSPYGETTINYVLSKFDTLSLDGRYGYDDGIYSQNIRSGRAGINLTHVFTPKLRGTLGTNYSHIDGSQINNGNSSNSSALNAVDIATGLYYAVSQNLSVFANYTHSRRSSENKLQEYSKNLYYLGLSYQY